MTQARRTSDGNAEEERPKRPQHDSKSGDVLPAGAAVARRC